jgi:homoserine O-succinyltransferase
MPLIIDGGRVPSGWAEKRNLRSQISNKRHPGSLSLALINNMPDAALEDTELQFFELLDIASGDVPVFIKLYSLTGIPRTDRGQRRLNSFYSSIDDLWNSPVDGLIMTGTEPHQADLRDEPYWALLTEVLDWAESNTVSTVLSCLAAHAGVLHSDGIERCRMSDKQFGVFEYRKSSEHALTQRCADVVRFPHSRWNEVREDELTACGYTVLTKSGANGVDLFVKKRKSSLFVHFQGHPEYVELTLLKEYRRDIKRFIRRERETYPSTPKGYFDAAATILLADFRKTVMSDRREELLGAFPEAVLVKTLQNTWRASATVVYSNWLQHLTSSSAQTYAFAPLAGLYGQHRKPFVAS